MKHAVKGFAKRHQPRPPMVNLLYCRSGIRFEVSDLALSLYFQRIGCHFTQNRFDQAMVSIVEKLGQQANTVCCQIGVWYAEDKYTDFINVRTEWGQEIVEINYDAYAIARISWMLSETQTETTAELKSKIENILAELAWVKMPQSLDNLNLGERSFP